VGGLGTGRRSSVAAELLEVLLDEVARSMLLLPSKNRGTRDLLHQEFLDAAQFGDSIRLYLQRRHRQRSQFTFGGKVVQANQRTRRTIHLSRDFRSDLSFLRDFVARG